MIINTGLRTDIPAFYAEWFFNRISAGYVMARSPYDPGIVYKYSLSPEVVDVFSFCTKNPIPVLKNISLLKDYGQYWFITLTPYDRDIEPGVPDKKIIMEAIRELSAKLGKNCVGWRYDPVLITEKYDEAYHRNAFETIASALEGAVETCVISFIDLYGKVRRNFPEAREVPWQTQLRLGEFFVRAAARHGMVLKPCAEGNYLSRFGADCGGCLTRETFEKALGAPLDMPLSKGGRHGKCACYMSCDIGAYDTCGHFCRYCYANSSAAAVRTNMKRHDPESPLITGWPGSGDIIREVKQKSWRTDYRPAVQPELF